MYTPLDSVLGLCTCLHAYLATYTPFFPIECQAAPLFASRGKPVTSISISQAWRLERLTRFFEGPSWLLEHQQRHWEVVLRQCLLSWGSLPHPNPWVDSLLRNFRNPESLFHISDFLFVTFSLQLVENHDCLFDDACAPELALDFDCQNISTKEGLASWAIGFGLFATLFYTIKFVDQPESSNPAITRDESDDIVIPLKHHE